MAGPGMGDNPSGNPGPSLLEKYSQGGMAALSPDEVKQLKFMPVDTVAAAQSAPPAYNPAAEMQGMQAAQAPTPPPKENIIKRGVDFLNNLGKVNVLGAAEKAGNAYLNDPGVLERNDPYGLTHMSKEAAAKRYQAMPENFPAAAPVTSAPGAISSASPSPAVPSAAAAPVQPTADVAATAGPMPKMPTDKSLAGPKVPPPTGLQNVARFTDYLKSQPNPLNLANILDVIGTSLSAYGGVNRQTRLQQQYNMQLQSQQIANQARTQLEQEAQLLPLQAQKEIQVARQTGNINVINAIRQGYGLQPLTLQQIWAQALVGYHGENLKQSLTNPFQGGQNLAKNVNGGQILAKNINGAAP